MDKVYNKLVRDNIPEIIRLNGQTPLIRFLDNDEYLTELNKKLQEEVAEYIADNCLDELCDILEVIYAIAKAKGYSNRNIEAKRNDKTAKNGAFEKKVFLEKVIMENK